jgi:hypothetical protein
MREIRLSKGLVAIVDDDDFEWLSQWKWSASGAGARQYAVRHTVSPEGRRRHVAMHRAILRAPDRFDVDHRNRNTIDNRRENLRLATQAQNNANSESRPGESRFKGVCRTKPGGRWKAWIRTKGRTIHLGVFDEERDAAHAYDAAARKHFGEFARPNFQEA